MSLRKIAKELGITPAYLSYMVNAKRPWRQDLYERYSQLVNTFVNSEAKNGEEKPVTRRYSATNLGSLDGHALHGVQGVVGSNPITPTILRLQTTPTHSYDASRLSNAA